MNRINARTNQGKPVIPKLCLMENVVVFQYIGRVKDEVQMLRVGYTVNQLLNHFHAVQWMPIDRLHCKDSVHFCSGFYDAENTVEHPFAPCSAFLCIQMQIGSFTADAATACKMLPAQNAADILHSSGTFFCVRVAQILIAAQHGNFYIMRGKPTPKGFQLFRRDMLIIIDAFNAMPTAWWPAR